MSTRTLTLIAAMVAAPVALAQASTLFTIPITGQFANGRAAAGQAIGHNEGTGEFWVVSPGFMRCFGNWDVRDPNPTIVIPAMRRN